MPIVANFVERLLLLELNLGPGLMLDFLRAQTFRVVCATVELGFIEVLSGGPLTAAEIACEIKASERGTTLLLDSLEALGYVNKAAGGYDNMPMAAKWLLRHSPASMAVGIPSFESMVFDCREHLDKSIRRGKQALYGSEWLDQHPGGYRVYEEGMIALARMAADEVAARMKLPPTARQLLDVGGGLGLYSIKFCYQYSDLPTTVFDLPQAASVARETITDE
jgi:hypothetical protein